MRLAGLTIILALLPLYSQTVYGQAINEMQCRDIRQAGFDAAWGLCESDQDCIVHTGMCGLDMALNKDYTQENTLYNRCMGPVISCANSSLLDKTQKVTPKIAACVNGQCTLLTK